MVEFVEIEAKVIKKKSKVNKGLLTLILVSHFMCYNVLFLSYIRYTGLFRIILFWTLQLFVFNAIFKRSNINSNQLLVITLTVINWFVFGTFSFIFLYGITTLTVNAIYIKFLIKEVKKNGTNKKPNKS